VRAGLGHVGQECVGEEDDLLLGFACVHRMDGEQVRGQLAGHRLPLLADRDSRVGSVGRPLIVQLRRDLHHLPAVGAVEAVVGGQQPLEQRGAAAHHAHHDDGSDDPLGRDLGMAPDPLLSAQSHPQAVNEPRPQNVDTDGVQVGGRVAVGEHAQRSVERQRPPVVEALLALCGRFD